MTTLPAIELPLNPESYYGQSCTVENLSPGSYIYIGPSRTAKAVRVDHINYNSEGWHELYTDHAVYIALPNTRVGFKNNDL
jgi:hypothetical protein